MSDVLNRQKALITAYQCVDKLSGFVEEVGNHIDMAKKELEIALALQTIDMGESAKINLKQLEIPFTDKIISSVPEHENVSPMMEA